jgi:hypothetical protein
MPAISTRRGHAPRAATPGAARFTPRDCGLGPS